MIHYSLKYHLNIKHLKKFKNVKLNNYLFYLFNVQRLFGGFKRNVEALNKPKYLWTNYHLIKLNYLIY